MCRAWRRANRPVPLCCPTRPVQLCVLKGNHIMKIINVISFLYINTLALLIVPRLAENLLYFGLHIIWRHHGNYKTRVLELDRSVHAPCLGRLSEHMPWSSLRAWVSFCMLSRISGTWRSSWMKTLMRLTGLSRSSPAAISLSISCVCLHANNNILKGRASAAYERALSDLESMSDDTWPTLLQHVLEYVKLLTNLEGPAPSAPTLTNFNGPSPPKENPASAHTARAPAPPLPSGGDKERNHRTRHHQKRSPSRRHRRRRCC